MGSAQSIVPPRDLQCAEGCGQPRCGHSKFASHGSHGETVTQSVNSFATAAPVYCFKHSYTMERDRGGIYQCFYCTMEHGLEHDPANHPDPLSDIRSTVGLEHTNLPAPPPIALGTAPVALGTAPVALGTAPVALSTGIQRMGSSSIGPTISPLKKAAPIPPASRQSNLPKLSLAEQFKRMSREEQMANLDIGNGTPGDAHHRTHASSHASSHTSSHTSSGIPRAKRGGKK